MWDEPRMRVQHGQFLYIEVSRSCEGHHNKYCPHFLGKISQITLLFVEKQSETVKASECHQRSVMGSCKLSKLYNLGVEDVLKFLLAKMRVKKAGCRTICVYTEIKYICNLR